MNMDEGGITRREFLERSGKIAVGVLAAMALPEQAVNAAASQETGGILPEIPVVNLSGYPTTEELRIYQTAEFNPARTAYVNELDPAKAYSFVVVEKNAYDSFAINSYGENFQHFIQRHAARLDEITTGANQYIADGQTKIGGTAVRLIMVVADGVYPDEIPDAVGQVRFNSSTEASQGADTYNTTLLHEMAHGIGLPDQYIIDIEPAMVPQWPGELAGIPTAWRTYNTDLHGGSGPDLMQGKMVQTLGEWSARFLQARIMRQWVHNLVMTKRYYGAIYPNESENELDVPTDCVFKPNMEMQDKTFEVWRTKRLDTTERLKGWEKINQGKADEGGNIHLGNPFQTPTQLPAVYSNLDYAGIPGDYALINIIIKDRAGAIAGWRPIDYRLYSAAVWKGYPHPVVSGKIATAQDASPDTFDWRYQVNEYEQPKNKVFLPIITK